MVILRLSSVHLCVADQRQVVGVLVGDRSWPCSAAVAAWSRVVSRRRLFQVTEGHGQERRSTAAAAAGRRGAPRGRRQPAAHARHRSAGSSLSAEPIGHVERAPAGHVITRIPATASRKQGSHRPQTPPPPRCCHLGSYFKRPKSSRVRLSACNRYYCALFIAKPKAACSLRFRCAASSSNLGL